MSSIEFSSIFTIKNHTWTEWKAIQASKGLQTQYGEDDKKYIIYGYDDPEVYRCTIFKGMVPDAIGFSQTQNDADKADFDDNYKPNANNIITHNKSKTSVVVKILATTSSTMLLETNILRKAVMVYNDSVRTLYLKFGAGATIDDFSVEVGAKSYFEFSQPAYVGQVTGIWSTGVAAGYARITEFI